MHKIFKNNNNQTFLFSSLLKKSGEENDNIDGLDFKYLGDKDSVDWEQIVDKIDDKYICYTVGWKSTKNKGQTCKKLDDSVESLLVSLGFNFKKTTILIFKLRKDFD